MSTHSRCAFPRLQIAILATLLAATAAQAQSFAPPAFFGSDALARPMPSPEEVRPFQNDKYVGIFYFAWLKHIAAHDNSLILANNPNAMTTNASPPWGGKGAFHFWGEPLFGYYRSDDPWILRRHADLLSDAGVDFLVLDTTNGFIYEDVVASTPADTDWEGFELMVRRGSIEASTGGWNWKPIGDARCRVEGNQMHVAVSKNVIKPYWNRANSGASIGFKWIDNSQSPGDIMDAYTNGDAAPGGRFRYRYRLR